MKPLMRLICSTFAGLALAACGTLTQASQAQSDDAQGTAASADGATQGTVASLQQLLATHEVIEIRSVHNGGYAASLFFQPDKLGYFVTLSHDRTFWRVLQTDAVKDAESSYAAFASQTAKLAEVDIDTLRLEAGKRYAQHLVAMNEARLHTLQADAARQQQQGQQVAALQAEGRQKAAVLSGDLRSASNQLDDVQQSIHKLEAQQGNPDLSLPVPASPSSAGPSMPAATLPGSPAQ